MALNVSFSRDYHDSLSRLEGVEVKRVLAAVSKFLDDPDHPSLNFEALQGRRKSRLYSIRGSGELRVLMAREGETYVLLYAGHHDDVYALAERKSFVVGQEAEHIGLFDLGNSSVPHAQPAAPTSFSDDDRPGVVDHWSDADLAGVGLTAEQLAALRSVRDLDNLLSKVPGLTDELFDLIWDVLEQTPEEFHQPVLGGDSNRLYEALQKHGGLGNLSQLFTPAEFEALTAKPIEAWMVFLHPDQRSLVRRDFSGPARVRGSAGTGKTVVALHRAAHLATRNASNGEPLPILFTTFVKSLPPVFERLYLRLPGSITGQVVFEHIDRVAREVCKAAGHHLVTAPREINQAYAAAFKRIVTPGSALGRSGFSRDYLREEITTVIKGRGLSSVDDYLEVERTGRRAPMGREQRSHLWTLREAWDDEMAGRGTVDFADAILVARDLARAAAVPTYSAAIVDEAQDLTLAGLQFIRALVNGSSGDRPNGLFLVGDGAQRIYPGGYTLRQAGIEVRGRTSVLRTNYRNTSEILAAAMAVGGDDEVDDQGDSFKRGEAPAEAQRRGLQAQLVACSDFDAQLDEIADVIAEVGQGELVGYGDIGVLVPTNKLVKAAIGGLEWRGHGCQNLQRYDGRPTDLVKVGTYHRAKGLEFKVVLLPGVTERGLVAESSDPAEVADRAALALSQLFVAMTRARDLLVVLHDQETDLFAATGDVFERRTRQ